MAFNAQSAMAVLSGAKKRRGFTEVYCGAMKTANARGLSRAQNYREIIACWLNSNSNVCHGPQIRGHNVLFSTVIAIPLRACVPRTLHAIVSPFHLEREHTHSHTHTHTHTHTHAPSSSSPPLPEKKGKKGGGGSTESGPN